MRKMPRGGSSTTPPSSSGVLRSTWKPLASRPFAVRRRISESSLSRPGECASSRKMPQYSSLTSFLLSKESLLCGAGREGFRQRHVLGAVHVDDRLDHLSVHRLARLVKPAEIL